MRTCKKNAWVSFVFFLFQLLSYFFFYCSMKVLELVKRNFKFKFSQIFERKYFYRALQSAIKNIQTRRQYFYEWKLDFEVTLENQNVQKLSKRETVLSKYRLSEKGAVRIRRPSCSVWWVYKNGIWRLFL